jgi:hypothetical protein
VVTGGDVNRRAFFRLLGLGLALGPEAIAEAMKPRIFYSIPRETSPFDYGFSAYDAVLRHVYESSIYDLVNQKSAFFDRLGEQWDSGPIQLPLRVDA